MHIVSRVLGGVGLQECGLQPAWQLRRPPSQEAQGALGRGAASPQSPRTPSPLPLGKFETEPLPGPALFDMESRFRYVAWVPTQRIRRQGERTR